MIDINPYVHEGARRILESDNLYAEAINLSARGVAVATREGYSDTHLKGMMGVVSILIGAYLDMMQDPATVRLVAEQVCAHWMRYETELARRSTS